MEALVTSFVAALLAGWSDKTQLVAAMLGEQARRPWLTAVGLILALAASNVIAALAGVYVAQLINLRAATLLSNRLSGLKLTDAHCGLRAFRASNGQLLWRRNVGGKILGGSFVAGNLVFTSTLAARTFALRASDGKILWRLNIGKYSPGIVTERHYFFTLNGIVMAWHGRRSPQILASARAKRHKPRKKSAQGRVTTTP